MATIINNVAYNWSMVRLTSELTAGNELVLQGVKGLKWNIKRNVKVNHGLQGEPVSRGFGNREYTASITMDYATQTQLRNLNGGLMNLGMFDLIVDFANIPGSAGVGSGESGVITSETITLKGCFFNEDGMESETDDSEITKEFDLNPFKIELSTI